ncbi:MAG: aspartate-semialdehyde dehydrogenase [Gemmatimonadetes bacterium]|nr:aspartate-semialdehyde dehydrogenase [Gemmatimonadota bacterium]
MKVAILGATGAVGRTMLQVLEERGFPAEEIVPLASPSSRGALLPWRGRQWAVEAPAPGVFHGCALALFSAGAARSREWAPRAVDEGAAVVDNTSAWRMHPEVPLVVPEVNAARIAERPRGIVANPNCVVIQLVIALEALRRAAGLRRVVASTYQSVSGAGQTGIRALRAELAGLPATETPFAAPIAGNVIPAIGAPAAGGWTEEEEKIRNESRKILDLPELAVSATCVRVPVEVGHAVAVTAETEQALSVAAARAALATAAGVDLLPEGQHALPRDVAGTDAVRVTRLRADPDLPRVLHFWVVADNLRKGAATNAVQIGEWILRERAPA